MMSEDPHADWYVAVISQFSTGEHKALVKFCLESVHTLAVSSAINLVFSVLRFS